MWDFNDTHCPATGAMFLRVITQPAGLLTQIDRCPHIQGEFRDRRTHTRGEHSEKMKRDSGDASRDRQEWPHVSRTWETAENRFSLTVVRRREDSTEKFTQTVGGLLKGSAMR